METKTPIAWITIYCMLLALCPQSQTQLNMSMN